MASRSAMVIDRTTMEDIRRDTTPGMAGVSRLVARCQGTNARPRGDRTRIRRHARVCHAARPLLSSTAMKKSFIFLSSLAFTFVLLRSDRADACGGCFAPPPQQSESTVVTDHRMALSISSQQTVLW